MGVLIGAQGYVHCFDEGFNCFSRQEADSQLFLLKLK